MAAVRDVTHENRRQFVYVCGANVTAKRDLASGFDTVDNCRELVAKRAVRKRGFRAINCDGEPRLKKRQQSDHVTTPWTLLQFVQERGGERVSGRDKVWCRRAVVAVQSNPVLDVHYIALRTACPQRDEACVLGNTHALFRRVKPIFSGRDQALLSSLLVRLSSKRRHVHRKVASLIVDYFRGIMSKSDLRSEDLPTTAPCLAAPGSESPERLQAAKASSSGKVVCQNGDPAEQVTPAKRPYEMHSTNSAERSGPRSKVSKLSLTYAQREKSVKAQNGTPPVPPSASSDTPAKEADVPSDVSAKETTARRKLSPLLVDASESVSESTATPTPLPENNSAAADVKGPVHSEDPSLLGDSSAHDPSGHTTTEPVGSVQKQAASVTASRLPAALANWSPTTVFSSKLGSRSSGRSPAILAAVSGNSVKGSKVVSNSVAALNASSSAGSACGNERQVVPEESARSPISIPSISSTSVPCEVPGSEETQGEPDAGVAVHSNVTARDDIALVWCECGFGPFDRGAFEAHSLTTHVKPFCHGCNLCGEKFAARKDLKCHFAVHSQMRESLLENDPKLSKGVAGRNESCTPDARNSLPGASLLSPADRVAEMTDNTDPTDPSRGRAHWFLRPDLDGSRALIHFFKCVVGECRYTTDLPVDFSSHLSSHRLKEMGDLVCIYCGEAFDAIATLVQHMERIHRNLTFQCGHCLYRSALPIHNHLHHGWFHRHQKREFFTCDNPGLHVDGLGLPTQHVSLTHYWCSITNCDFKSFNPDVFEWHLSAAHPKTKKYSCYNCEERVNSPQALLQHCVKHDMDIVQCGVCHHSEPSFRKMLRHLCEHHPDSPLELSFRTNGQAAEFEKYVKKLQVSFELSAANMHESADSSSSDVDGMPVSTPQNLFKRCEVEGAVLRTARSSVKTCPFCTHKLVSLEDLTEHCVIAHQISLAISAILELMLKKKQHAAAAGDESLSCPFCDTAPSDKDELERHMYEEFEYAPMQCEACGYSTFRREVLKEHFRTRHPQRRPAFTVRRHDDFESWVASFVAGQEARRTILEKPYQCVHCGERLRCTKELRMHLYAHLQYYPHHCTICEKCFTSQQDVEEHQRALHAVTDTYSIEEVRFENKEVKIDDLIDEAAAKLRAVVESPPGRQCMWVGCPYSSSNPTDLVAHMKAHIEQRKVCTTCQFSTYCNDILAWHSRQHSPVSSSTEVLQNPAPTSPVPKVKSRAYACCWCNHRGPSSMEIRAHCKIAHPGKAVKLMAPKRKDLHAPTARRVSTDSRRREDDVTNRVDKGAGMDEAMDVEGQHDVVAPPIRDTCVRERQHAARAGARVDSLLAACTLARQQLKCEQCEFLASSPRLLRLHESILHAGCVVTSTSGMNVASAVSKVLVLTAKEVTAVPSVRPDQRPAVVGEPVASSQSTSSRSTSSRAARGESTCKKCFKHFQSKLLLYHHLVLVHHVYAVCDTCGANLMNKANAQVHVSGKHLPEIATCTILRSKEFATLPPPAAAVSRDARTPPSASATPATIENDNIYVFPLDSCDEPVPFHVYMQQHNVNPRVCLKDISKLHSLA